MIRLGYIYYMFSLNSSLGAIYFRSLDHLSIITCLIVGNICKCPDDDTNDTNQL